MEKHAPKLNNTETFPSEGHQVPEITKYDEVNKNLLAPGAEDDDYSSDEDYCRDDSETESEFDDDDFVPETQDYVLDPRSNGG